MNYALKIKDDLEDWRETAAQKYKKYRKNKRFKAAAGFWHGYAQACANAKCIAYGYARLIENEKTKRPGAEE